MEAEAASCALCGLEAEKRIQEGSLLFCCPGCRAVFHLLTSKGVSDGFQNHPLFRQALELGILSNPKLEEKLVSAPLSNVEKKKILFEIEEMWCPSCAEVITWLLLLQKGVVSAKVDYLTDLAQIEFYPQITSEKALFDKIRAVGYRPTVEEKRGKEGSSRHVRFYIASFLTLNIMMFSYPIYASLFDFDENQIASWMSWLSFFFSIPMMTWVLWPIWRRGAYSLVSGIIGMELLILLSTTSAFVLSTIHLYNGADVIYFDSLSTIITLVFLGKILEARAKFEAKCKLHWLGRSIPEKGRSITGEMILLKEVKKGALLRVLKGEAIPLDGEVFEGTGYIDTSAVTGESAPRFFTKGEPLIASSIVLDGTLVLSVTKEYAHSTAKTIASACIDGLVHKSPYIRDIDSFISPFVLFVIVLASYALYSSGVEAFLSTLLIACPCAIAVAAPLVEMRLFSLLAEMGIFVRNRGAFRPLAQASRFALDKTGTITQGKAALISGIEQLSSEERSLVKGMAQHSIHPLSKAIFDKIEEPEKTLVDVCEYVGRGLEWQGYLLGSRRFMRERGIFLPNEDHNETEVFFVWGKRPLTRIVFIDPLKDGVAALIQELPSPTLLSGDTQKRVESIGFPVAFGELDPLEKREKIRAWQKKGEVVVFIGDGINDAPALSQAEVGIAVGKSSAMTQLVADIWLTEGSLVSILSLWKLSKKGRKLIWQNLFFAFAFNIIGLFLAANNQLSPLFATVAMMISSLLIIMNTCRLRGCL